VRIWDVSPGYLNRQSLLGEHRELHGLHSILVNGKTGYSRHPETLRWVGCLPALAARHRALVAEMRLRGYEHHSPLEPSSRPPKRWPDVFIDSPARQYALLGDKYRDRESGRIPLPRNAAELWAQHKYSVMARDPDEYRAIGRVVARMRRGADMTSLADDLVGILQQRPSRPRLLNALEHMWGYVSSVASADEKRDALRSSVRMLQTTCALASRHEQPYLLASTALSDLATFMTMDGE
jgi:hypothetical protein